MGRTLFCDCCGQDIREADQFYIVNRIPKYLKTMADALNYRAGSKEDFIICSDCMKEVGRRVQEKNRPVEFEVVMSNEEN